jgi:hypothetical protein
LVTHTVYKDTHTNTAEQLYSFPLQLKSTKYKQQLARKKRKRKKIIPFVTVSNAKVLHFDTHLNSFPPNVNGHPISGTKLFICKEKSGEVERVKNKQR